MCELCDKIKIKAGSVVPAVPIADKKINFDVAKGIYLNMFLSSSQTDYYIDVSFGHEPDKREFFNLWVKIKYCPFCGKELKK